LKRFPKIRIVIAGDGPHRNEYEKKAKELNVHENVTFLGFIDEELIHILLTHCEMTIIPSYYEPFGIVALESMAAKKLTIAANTGGLKEIIKHNENGLLFERGNSKALASAILEALQHKERADRLAQQGYKEILSRFAYEHIVKKVIQEYEVLYHKR
jgi:1,4-alpha-glucan branching enzyme